MTKRSVEYKFDEILVLVQGFANKQAMKMYENLHKIRSTKGYKQIRIICIVPHRGVPETMF